MLTFILTALALLFLSIVVFYTLELNKNKQSEDVQHSIYFELRSRSIGRKKENPLSKYSDQELEIFKEQLRDIVFKKRLRHKLNEDEKALIKRFRNSYSIAKLRYKDKK